MQHIDNSRGQRTSRSRLKEHLNEPLFFCNLCEFIKGLLSRILGQKLTTLSAINVMYTIITLSQKTK